MTERTVETASVEAGPALPRPFQEGWPRVQEGAARALWAWHLSLLRAQVPPGEAPERFFRDEAARAAEGEPLRSVPEEVARDAYAACRTHGLPPELLAAQAGAARHFHGPIRFATTADLNGFLETWAHAHGRLLAHLAGAAHSWQLRYVDELAGAFFLVGRLAELPQDLAQDRLYLPLADLEQYGVDVAQLRAGRLDDAVRRLLWKETIRARDAFAHGLPLVHEVPRRMGRQLRTWWLGGLEMLNEIERRRYDVWSRPLRLSARHRLQVRFQARFARTTFRPR